MSAGNSEFQVRALTGVGIVGLIVGSIIYGPWTYWCLVLTACAIGGVELASAWRRIPAFPRSPLVGVGSTHAPVGCFWSVGRFVLDRWRVRLLDSLGLVCINVVQRYRCVFGGAQVGSASFGPFYISRQDLGGLGRRCSGGPFGGRHIAPQLRSSWLWPLDCSRLPCFCFWPPRRPVRKPVEAEGRNQGFRPDFARSWWYT